MYPVDKMISGCCLYNRKEVVKMAKAKKKKAAKKKPAKKKAAKKKK